MARWALSALLLLPTLGGACASRDPAAPAPDPPVALLVRPDGSYEVTNDDGTWTIRSRCETNRRWTVGPGYVSRLVTREGITIVDDRRRRGTLNDPEFGGLGAFGWHHARGRAGRLRFGGENAWEISGRICAAANRGFGVVRSYVPRPPRATADGALELAVDVLFSDMFTYPDALARVRYRYRFEPSVVKSWVEVLPLCGGGRCGRTRALAFVKEPKLVAHVTGGGFTRMATFGEDGSLDCIYLGGGSAGGPIYDTGQCGADGRTRLRFDFGTATSGSEGGCEAAGCLNVVARSYPVRTPPGEATSAWEGSGAGLDEWALSAAKRPRAFRADTGSLDGVVWRCHGATPAGEDVRRWETTGRRAPDGRYLSLGGLFPAWEGGRGGYDCEPLARAFGPLGESWAAFLSYSIGAGWEELR